MARKKRTVIEGHTETMEEFLARGGRIEICPPGMRSEDVREKFRVGRGRRSAKKKRN